MSSTMDMMSRILTILLCIHGLETTYITYVSADRGLMAQQQVAPVQERIVNSNPDAEITEEQTDYSESKGKEQGVPCTIGRLFFLTEKGRLMRCDTDNLSVEEQTFSAQDSPPHFLLPGLPSVGLAAFYSGSRLPGIVQNLNIQGTGGIDGRKPVVIKPKPEIVDPVPIEPVVVKPIKPLFVKPIKPLVLKPIHKPKPVHKPLVHKHPHQTHHHGLLHVSVPGLTFYHQTGLDSVNHEGQLREDGLGWNPTLIPRYPYWYFRPPHREAFIQKLPTGAERVLASLNPAANLDRTVSDDLKEDEESMGSDGNYNKSIEHTLIGDYRTQMMIDQPKNFSVNGSNSEIGTNSTGERKEELKPTDKQNFGNATDSIYRVRIIAANNTLTSELHEPRLQGNEMNVSTTEQFTKEPNTEKHIVEDVELEEGAEEGLQKEGVESSLSEGPDVLEDPNGEEESIHIRKIRDAPGIPIETLNDQQNPSSSILDRNTLLNIMSSLKEQYLKNAEPDQRKLIEDAFDRLHCSVRDMKKLDERPSGKKIDGPKKAALKLLAERAQPLIEEPDYYSDATDDVSAEPSFLELLNVATKHKGKQSIDGE
ncbi:hypothetical protein GE061_000541 [Apolygus lucorum]|uniref:Uncharacterized protein n=1 Tax=Apolygus lucorum TaxID=248454 RepID=A0A8S9Y6I3_APOLU|nr:hypothetical protein GE061_000541 [Apolygus lucorum]